MVRRTALDYMVSDTSSSTNFSLFPYIVESAPTEGKGFSLQRTRFLKRCHPPPAIYSSGKLRAQMLAKAVSQLLFVQRDGFGSDTKTVIIVSPTKVCSRASSVSLVNAKSHLKQAKPKNSTMSRVVLLF